MKRPLLALSVALTLWVGGASAQPPPTPAPSPAGANQNEPPAAPLPWLFAAIFTIVTLVIICMPTRKA
jgi:hypothetical protein